MKMIKRRRKRYLINKSLQLRYMGMVVVLMAIISVATGWVIYSTTWMTLIDKLEGKEVMLDKIFMDLNNLLLTRISLLILIGVCLGAIIVMFIVHRIAGPLFRVERIMRTIGKGIIPEKVKFRKLDELKDLAEAINETISKITEVREKNSQVADNIETCLKKALEYLKSTPPKTDKAIEEVESAGRDIEGFEIFKTKETQT